MRVHRESGNGGEGMAIEGTVAIVTGGGSGIGRAIGVMAASAGASVALLGRSHQKLLAVEREISALGGVAVSLVCDVGNFEQVSATVAEVEAVLGAPTMLFNAAAILQFERMERITPEMFGQMLQTNLSGVFYMSQAAMPHLLRCGGSIVNISSLAGHLGVPYSAHYSAAKGGIVAMTKSMAKEFADRGVRINVIAPGAVETEMGHTPFPADASEGCMGLIPISPIAWSDPVHVAKLALALSSGDFGNLTGALIPIDGASS